MKALILCAGYATRLYPLTLNQPKQLLSIASRPMLDYSMDKIEQIDEIDEVYVVTNEKFAPSFEAWAKNEGAVLAALATRRASSFYTAIGYEESASYFRKLL